MCATLGVVQWKGRSEDTQAGYEKVKKTYTLGAQVPQFYRKAATVGDRTRQTDKWSSSPS